MKRILPAQILAFSLLATDCKLAANKTPIDFIERNAVASPDRKVNPLLLVVEIDENGKLSLNKIETGTVADPTELNGKLSGIFADREKSSIGAREVIVDQRGYVGDKDFERLIESLREARAAPIRVIKPER